MNLSEERNYQKRMDTLDLMGLTEQNRILAEQYLDMTGPENRELLEKAEHQDFSVLDQEKRRKCNEYAEHLKKRGRMDEVGRYVRFAAAVGGSTAYYVLLTYGWNLNAYQEFLTREQTAAMRAEGIAWNNYALKNAVSGVDQKNPKVLRDAMNLCYHKSDNARVLLAGISLYHTRSEKAQGGFLKALFSKGTPEEGVQDAVKCVESNLIGSISNLFTGARPTDAEIQKLQSYVRDGKVNEPFPQELYDILRGKQVSEYLETLLAGVAFLAIEHSSKCVSFLCLTAAMDAQINKDTTLDICIKIGGGVWFFDHIEELENLLPIKKERYLFWCLRQRVADAPLRRMIQNHPEVIKQVIPQLSTDDYQNLLKKAETANPELYREMSASSDGEFRMKLAEELVSRINKGKAEAKQYLLGEENLDTLYPFVEELRGGYDYDTNRCQKIRMLKGNGKEQQMYRRAVVLEGLGMKSQYFRSYWYDGSNSVDKQEIMDILKIYGEEQLPFAYQMDSLGAIYDGFYSEKSKVAYMDECVSVLRMKKPEWGGEFASAAKEGSAIVRYLCIRVLDYFWQEYSEVLLSCAMDSSKQVRELLEAVYVSHREWEPQIKAMLSSKKSQEREMSVLVLKKWGVSSYRDAFEAALAVEKSKKIKELLQNCLGIESDEAEQAGEQTTGELAKAILKGGKKRKVAWVFETGAPFTEVHKLDGTPASEDDLAAVLVAYADMNIPGVNKEAAKLAADLNAKELAFYMGMLFNKWLETGAESKKKWVLYATSIHGGEEIVPVLHAQIKDWAEASRGAIAADAVKALSVNGSPTALLIVDQISRKFKHRQVRKAAADALTYAAKELGITRAELEDRIVPNLGFNERMEQTFDYGTRSFKVTLTAALELQVYDEDGKKVKSLPAPGKKDDPEKSKAASDAYKLLKKQLKAVVTNQKLRLEQALSAERLWKAEQWKELFVKNPVMHQFAIGLIWGVYADGALTSTFRYMEDGSFNTMDEDEYELPEDAMIGLVHPIELDEESLKTWKEQLSDYEVTQPIEQLERPIYRITEEEKKQKELTRFGGKLLNGLSLSGKLQSQGWYRGSVQDAGGYYDFYREDENVGVDLEFSGSFVGDENDEVTVYSAKFYKARTVERGSYVYDMVKEENQYALSEVSPRYFSEIVLQLTKATASSQEQLPYPECKKNQ
ncbi:MAG: DUF4132 domain-containing protein [Lachnospiraceae bacterium]|nr:DUF4132 domain-containing protein [Lachnospiraceae bacterium]